MFSTHRIRDIFDECRFGISITYIRMIYYQTIIKQIKMNPVLIDLVSEDEMQVNTVVQDEAKVEQESDIVVSHVLVDLVSDGDDVVSVCNKVDSVVADDADAEVDMVSCSEVDSDFLQIKAEERQSNFPVNTIVVPDFNVNKRLKTNGNKHVRMLRRSKVFLKQILLELDESDEEAEDYEGDVDVGPLDDEDYDIGPVIQTA